MSRPFRTRDTTLSRPVGELQLSRSAASSRINLFSRRKARLLFLERADGFLGAGHRFEHAAGAVQVFGVAGFEETLRGAKAVKLARLCFDRRRSASSGGAGRMMVNRRKAF